jgi:cell division transport system permease protein
MWTLYYFVREVFSNLRSNPLIVLAAYTTVLVLVLILGMFSIIILNTDNIAKQLVGDLRVVTYLNDNIESSKIPQVKQKLLTLPHVQMVILVSKEEALERLMKRLNGRFDLNDITKNPLPDSLEISVDDPVNMAAVAKAAAALPQIQKVKYGEAVAHKMLAFTRLLRWTGGSLLLVLFLSTILVISNTIRLTVFARRREIEIMQMVGAARWFVQIPFILEGMLVGLAGSGTACVLLSSSYEVLVPQLADMVPFVSLLAPAELLPLLGPVLVALGIFVGAAGSWISINRYLKV